MQQHRVPLLITWDVDPDFWLPLEVRHHGLDTAVSLCHSLGIRATFYFTAAGAHLYPERMKTLQSQGHEIGCHGLTHGDEEDYDRMSPDLQDAYIAQATEKLSTFAGATLRAFRSPRVKTSAHTLKRLGEYGYWTDSSVCSQRMDLISSNLINVNWLRAPRRAYHPHRENAFKPGDLPIWEVPVSAAGLPFISAVLNALGPVVMKGLFRLLYAESRLTGKPIVYLAHPVEFRQRKKPNQAQKKQRGIPYLNRRFLSPSFIRTHGFRIRKLLYRTDGQELLANTRELFSFMLSFPGIVPVTASEYAIQYLQAEPTLRGKP
ncbi:MAG: polysaccharide deacetylase family protein [Chloroflexota bacterium]